MFLNSEICRFQTGAIQGVPERRDSVWGTVLEPNLLLCLHHQNMDICTKWGRERSNVASYKKVRIATKGVTEMSVSQSFLDLGITDNEDLQGSFTQEIPLPGELDLHDSFIKRRGISVSEKASRCLA